MIFDKEIRERQAYLRSIAPKDPAQWTTRKPTSYAGDPGLLDRVLAGRTFKNVAPRHALTCLVCGEKFYSFDAGRCTCFECRQWTEKEGKRNKQQLNLFSK